MTKTEAKRLAKRARQYGHFQKGSVLWVRCPKCKRNVGGSVPSSEPQMAGLDEYVALHLMDDCESTVWDV